MEHWETHTTFKEADFSKQNSGNVTTSSTLFFFSNVNQLGLLRVNFIHI